MTDTQMMYREWADMLPHVVFEIDTTGNVVFVNGETFNTFGYTRDDFDRGFKASDMFVPEDRDRVEESIRRTLNGDKLVAFELTALRKDSTRFPVLAYGAAIIKEGKPVGLTGSLIDITRQKQMEETLYRIQKAVESSNEAIGMSDLQGNHFYQNKAFTELFGYTAEELAAKGGGPAVYADPDVARDVFSTIMSGDSWAGEIEMISKNGDKFPVSLSADAVEDDNGEIIGLIGIHTDITERKKAEQALRDSEEKFRTVFENANDEIVLVNIDGTIKDVNKNIISGVSRDELIGKNIAELDMFKPDQLAEINKLFYEAINEGKILDTIELEGVDENGNMVNLEVRTNLIRKQGEIQGAVAIISDITKRKRAEEALQEQHNAAQTYAHELEAVNEELRSAQEKLTKSNLELQESEKKYRDLADLLPQTVFETDLEGNCTYANRHALKTFGFTQEDLDKGLNALELFTDTDRKRAEQNIERKLRQEEFQGQEYTAVRKDGSTMPVLLYTDLIIHNDEPTGIRGIVFDITERKQAEEALRESEQRYRLLADNVTDVIWTVDLNWRINYITPSITQLLGYTVDEAMAITTEAIYTPDSLAIAAQAFAEEMAIEEVPGNGLRRYRALDLELIRKDRSTVTVEAKFSFVRDSEGQPVEILAIVRDITERKQSEAQLKDSEAQYRSIAETVIEGIYQVDAFGIYVFVNEAYARIMGYETEELLGKHYHMVIPEESIEAANKITEEARSGKIQEGEFVLKHKLGHGVPAHFSMGAWERQGQQNGFIGTIHDITKRKQAEEELRKYRDHLEDLVAERTAQLTQMNEDMQKEITEREIAEEALQRSERYYRHLIENSSDIIIVLNDKANIQYVSPSVTATAGYNSNDLIGKNAFDFLYPDELEKFKHLFDENIHLPGTMVFMETKLPTKDGEWRYVEITAQNLVDEPAIQGVVLNVHDINERKQVEETLKESEEKFRTIFENVNDGIIYVDMSGTVIDTNSRSMDIFGYKPKKLIGKNFSELGIIDSQYMPVMTDHFSDMIHGKRNRGLTYLEVRHKNGNIVNVEASVSPIKVEGAIEGLLVIARDITKRRQAEEETRRLNSELSETNAIMEEEINERKRAEEALRKSEESYKELFESTSEGLVVLDTDTMKIVLVNEAMIRLFGFDSSEDAVGVNPLDFIHPDDRDKMVSLSAERIFQKGSPEPIECRAITMDNREIVIEAAGTTIELQEKPAFLVSIWDITERKQAEQALRDSEERFRAITENSEDAITLLDAEGVITYISPSLQRIAGYEEHELIGTPFWEYMHPDDLSGVERNYVSIVSAPGVAENIAMRLKKRNGEWLWVEGVGKNCLEDPGIKAIVCNYRDITERRRAEEALRKSEERFRSMIENALDGIAVLDSYGTITYEAPSNNRIFGYGSQRSGVLSLFDQIHPEDQERIVEDFATVLKEPNNVFTASYRTFHKDGRFRVIEGTGRNLLHDPNIQGIVVNFRDITERRRVEDALKESEEKFRTIFENANDEILYLDNDGTVIDVNRKIEETFGYKPEDVIGKKFTEHGLVSPTYIPAMEKGFTSMMGGNESAGVIELEAMDKDDNTVFIEASVSPLEKDGKIEGMLAIVRDITERKRSEEELRQYSVELQQANSELTEYAQVVAHDIGTPLRAIRYHTRILRRVTPETPIDDQRNFIDAIDDAVTECEELTQNLQGLARIGRSELRIEPIDVGELLQRLVSSSGIPDDTEIVMAEEWPTIDSDTVLLSHIFRNLIDNAIKFNNAPDKRVEIKWSTSGRGKYEFSVCDNGIGIAPKNQEMIFQVFKRLHHQDKYKGTGIGLAIVKKAASLLGGSVRVESKLDKGSTFVVTIPKSQKKRKK